MCRWIVDGAAEYDARSVLQALHPAPGGPGVDGLDALLEKAQLRPEVLASMRADVAATGAVAVGELTQEDWQGLLSWQSLRVMERRRLLNSFAGTR